ncbi:signal transduction histidine kinase [Asanoa ferruginea]|uniref:Oxygen sensor histidine kinase NreB n=1 Tax=Asanoa ferruginea TaxID=53367 RepID=A0A3D9ZLR0_9ACTN|nr:sensor histidine kinase [Asanoa ferruginea]REF98151.1 signal transduction histidine kinase [Asanoa ferruginea]GIF50882.1 histidine kinase [Asanoa ferruginea]
MRNAMPLAVDAGTERWVRFAHRAVYGLLAVMAGVTVLLNPGLDGDTPLLLGLILLMGLWILCLFTLRPAARTRALPMSIFFVGLYAILLLLVLEEPYFGFLTPIGYFFAFGVLPWPWRIPGVIGVAAAAGIAQAAGIPLATAEGLLLHLAIILINAAPMTAFAWIDWHGDKEREERARTMVELRAANERLETTLAENASLHERLLGQAREAGIHEERQRMAREIHDTLAQGLTGIVTQLQAAEQAATEPDRWRRHLGAATDLARESLQEARRSVHALRPEPLRGARLGDAVAGVAQRWSARHGIPVEVTTTGTERPMAAEAELALLRTAQEALANVAAHAGATRVGVTLSYLDGEVALDVRDDGRGFDPAKPPVSKTGGGFGLLAMRQRIEQVAGTLQVESEPSAGTAISASIPAGAAA